MFSYHEPLFRPPSEADSLIFQVTLGCSHNRCSFCSMYRTTRFQPRPEQEVLGEIEQARSVLGPEVPRVFLADGDALCLSTRRLLRVLKPLNEAFPKLQRVGIYANARDVGRKTDQELAELRRHKLKLLYIGLESGDDETLANIEKGATADELVQAVRRARAADMRTSVMVLIGLAGRARSLVHARASAEAINRMAPNYTALLTYIPTPGSPLFDAVERGDIELPDAKDSIAEIREFVGGLDCRTYFTCNHASNYLPLRGHMPGARDELLAVLDAALAGQLPLKPEFLRGL